jgi:hypothetical protein
MKHTIIAALVIGFVGVSVASGAAEEIRKLHPHPDAMLGHDDTEAPLPGESHAGGPGGGPAPTHRPDTGKPAEHGGGSDAESKHGA